MLPGESGGESAAAGGRRSRAEIVSHPRSEHNARSGAIKQESSPVNTINEGRRPGTKKRGRQRKDGDTMGRGEEEGNAEKGTRVPFERSCLLLVFDVSEEIMPRGM